MVMRDGPNKGRRFLVCSENKREDKSSCQFFEFEQEKVRPLPGDGSPCPVCKKGHLVTKLVRKEGPNKGKRFLVCSENKMGDKSTCQHFAWPGEGKSRMAAYRTPAARK